MLASFIALLVPPLVSYESNAVPVAELVASLASQSGQRLEAGKEIASEPVIVQFKDKPLDDVLKILADVLQAEWTTSSGALRLGRSSSLMKTQESAEQAVIAARVKDMLQAAGKTAEDAPQLDANQALLLMDRYRLVQINNADLEIEIQRMATQNPVARAAAPLILHLTKDLATMKSRDRVVFSDSPTPAQRLLPSKASTALRDLRAALQLLEEAKEKVGVKKNQRFIHVMGMPTLGPATTKDGYGKTLLMVERLGTLAYSWKVLMVAKDGAGVLTGAGRIPEQTMDSSYGASHKGVELELSEAQTTFAELWNFGYQTAGVRFAWLPDGSKITGSFGVSMHESKGNDTLAPIRHLLNDPMMNDPLGILPGPLVRQFAGSRPLIASIPDTTIADFARRINQDKLKTIGDVTECLEQTRSPAVLRLPYVVLESKEDWLLVKPYLPVSTRKAGIARVPLRELMSSIKSQGTLTLSAATNYYRASGRVPSFGSLDMIYAANVDAGLDDTAVQDVFNSSLPFLASLSPAQWQSAKAGLSLGEMTTGQRAILQKWAYIDFLGNYERVVPERGKQQMGFQRHYPLDIESTEMFPRGLPPATTVTISTTETPVVLAKASSGFNFTIDAESLGLFDTMRENPVQNPEAAARNLEAFRMGRRIGYKIVVQLTDDLAPQYGVGEVQPIASSTYGPRENLPKAFLRKVEEAKAAFEKQWPKSGGM
ncbi:MAG: hypothetical protein ACAH95_02195 [Fimbriimonas sp.]